MTRRVNINLWKGNVVSEPCYFEDIYTHDGKTHHVTLPENKRCRASLTSLLSSLSDESDVHLKNREVVVRCIRNVVFVYKRDILKGFS